MSANDPDKNREFVGHLLKVQPRVYALVRATIANRADAEDVYQDVVTVLWTKFDEFEQGTNFLAWAYQTARFKVQHYYRSQARDRTNLSPELVELLADTSEGQADGLADMREALVACMAKLKTADRDVVRRCYAQDTTVREVADELGRPFDTIKSVLKRARRQLYECIRRTLADDSPAEERRR